MTPWRRTPRRFAAAIGAAQEQWEPATLLAQVQRLWPGVVGEAISDQAVPTTERGGVLTVSCSASVWAQELDLMAPSILARLNSQLEGHEVHRLRCVAMPLGDRS
ncbi:MAG: DUF721 domain-containing protein [Solirubrobacterales bacterium]|nr:DUF721 domain-containing protein [Solirubrobacterales bacterium]